MRYRTAVRLFLPALRALLAASACCIWALCPALAQIEAPVRPRPTVATQAPGKTGFRAVSYEVFASLVPESQMLTARVMVEFQAQTASRTVECQLHPNLMIAGVRDSSGNSLSADRNGQDGLDVSISLPNIVPAGQSIKLTFDYSGILANEDNSPVAGVRLASIAKDGAYLLLPARWFPLTDYPANRFTGVFHIEVPQNFAVVGTGTSQAPAPASSQAEPVPSPSPMLGNRNPNTDGGSPRLARRNQDAAYPTSASSRLRRRRLLLPRRVPRPRVRESRTHFASINRKPPAPSLPARCNFLPYRPRD